MHKYNSLYGRLLVAALCVAGVLGMTGCSHKDSADAFSDVKPNESLTARVQQTDPAIVQWFADDHAVRVDAHTDANGGLKLRATYGGPYDGLVREYTVPVSNVTCKVVINKVQQCGLATVAPFSVYWTAKAGGGTEAKAGSEADQDQTNADVVATEITAALNELQAQVYAEAIAAKEHEDNRSSWAHKPAPPAPAKAATSAAPTTSNVQWVQGNGNVVINGQPAQGNNPVPTPPNQ